MADVKISALPALTSAALTDLFAVVQGGVTYKGTLTQLVAAIPDATGSTRGLLASADWTTFNSKQAGATNLTSLSGLTFVSTSFVKMTAAGTFALDTNTYLTAAITSLGGLTGATQTLAVGTAGTNFAIVSSGTSHTFNLPDASGSNRGVVTTGTQTFAGNKTFTGESATVGNALVVNNLTPTAKFTVANAGRVSLTSDTTVTTQTVSVITTDTTNAGLVLRPNGTGAIMAQAPDGTATGGNARGTRAVDLQMERSANTQVASGNNSVLLGGQNNTASNIYCIAGGFNATASSGSAIAIGYNVTASGPGSIALGGAAASGNISASGNLSLAIGQQATATANYSSCIGGIGNTASGEFSFAIGYQSLSSLYSQSVRASGSFAGGSIRGDAQTSSITLRRAITGTAQTELFLDGSSLRAILNIASPGPTNARLWNAYIQVVAIVQTVGNGTVTLGDSLIGNYMVGIKRIGTATSLVGTVQTIHTIQADAGMAGAAVTITADDTNEALKIEFTPATNAGTTTVTRVVATAYLTEVGY